MVDAGLMHYRKKQRRIIFVFFFLSGLISASWSARNPDIQHKLGINNAAFGTVLFSLYAGLFFGLAVAGWLVTSFGAKKILIITSLISAVLLVLAATTSLVWMVMLILFLVGFVRTILNLSANTAAIEVQTHYGRPIVAGFHGVWSVACFIAGGIGTAMIILGVNPFFHFLLIAIVIWFAVFFVAEKNSDTIIIKERRPFFVKPDKYLLLLGIMALCAMMCEGAMFDWSVNYFVKVIHPKRSLITVGYMAFIITMASGRLIGDRLMNSYGIARMIAINGVLVAIGFLIAARFPFVLPAAFGFLLIGMGDSILIPAMYMLAAKTNKMPAAYALSSVTLIGNTGFLIGPLFIGNISETFGMQSAFYCLSALGVVISVLSLRVKKMADSE